MAVLAYRLGGLQRVNDLRQRQIGVAVVNQGIQKINRFPDAHLGLVELAVFGLFGEDEIERLVGMIEPVQLSDRGAGFGLVVAEVLRAFDTVEERRWNACSGADLRMNRL